MGKVALTNEVVEIGQVPSGGFLMGREVKVASGGNSLQLGPAEREFVLDIEGASRVVRQLFLAMRAQPQMLSRNAESQVPVQSLFLPVLEPLHLVRGRHEVLQFHLLELAQPED